MTDCGLSRLLLLALVSFPALCAASEYTVPDPDDVQPYGPYDTYRYDYYDAPDYPRRPWAPYEHSRRPRAGLSGDCDAAFTRYRESMECFARFRNVNGSVKAEAYRYCTPVADPSPRCGPSQPW